VGNGLCVAVSDSLCVMVSREVAPFAYSPVAYNDESHTSSSFYIHLPPPPPHFRAIDSTLPFAALRAFHR
jgi:hypothetical protein